MWLTSAAFRSVHGGLLRSTRTVRQSREKKKNAVRLKIIETVIRSFVTIVKCAKASTVSPCLILHFVRSHKSDDRLMVLEDPLCNTFSSFFSPRLTSYEKLWKKTPRRVLFSELFFVSRRVTAPNIFLVKVRNCVYCIRG